jgi:hypothetical protein
MLKYGMTVRSRVGFVALLAAAAALTACGGAKKIVVEDFTDGRVVDLSITEKMTGTSDFIFFSTQKKTKFLEGYIQGVITDYSDNPIQGVVVRAVPATEASVEEEETGGAQNFAVSSFDPGVSDTNGFYRIRFTLPISKKLVDLRGKLIYNPGWEQERELLGKAYEPQLKQSQFRLYYEQARGRITFVEGIRKAIVAPILGSKTKAAGVPGTKPAGSEPPASDKPAAAGKGDEDLFKGFGF